MKKKSVFRKVLAVTLSAVTLLGTGFTTAGGFVGTNAAVSAANASKYGIVGNMTAWGASNDFPMYETEPGIYVGKTDVLSAGEYYEFKVRADEVWLDCWGVYEEDYNRTYNSQTNIEISLLSDAAIAVKLDTTGDDDYLWPVSYAIVKDGSTNYDWIYTGKPTDDDPIGPVDDPIENDFAYGVTEDNTIKIKKYTGNGGDVVIPDTIDGKSVTAIDESAFEGCTGLTSINIPDSVTRIGGAAFEGCKNLTSVTIGNSVISIAGRVFTDCTSLTNINIPESMTYIGFLVFFHCTSLKIITIPDSVTSIGRNAFSGCTDLTIYGKKGSYAETYANKNDIPFVSVNGYTNISTISTDEIVLGGTVTVNAKAILGDGDYTYAALYRKKTDTKWTVKQNYSTNDTITIKPAKATDYDVCVKVKDSTGKIVKKFFEVKVNAKLKNTSTISATTIKKGNTVTLNGSATGGMGGYTYAALYKKKAETKWTTRQGYKDNSEIIVRPYTNTDYDICIKVKDETGTIAKKYFTVTVTK